MIKFLSFLVSLIIVIGPVYAAETDTAAVLTEEQKIEKRLLFSQYVEEETIRRNLQKKKITDTSAAETKKNWLARFSSVYGYDSNVNLNSSRRGDGFFQETLDLSFTYERPTLPVFTAPGKAGVSFHQEFFNYENMESLDYTISRAGVYTEDKLTQELSFKLPYEFSFIRYPQTDQITYYSHKLKPMLTQVISDRLSHFVYSTFEVKDFLDRRALNSFDLPQKKGRVDLYCEPGYGLRFFPNANTFLGISGAWKLNDSNDVFLDFNDYTGHKITGYLYYKPAQRVSLMGYGGYDHKDYDSRIFSNAERGTEREADDFFYAGGYLYYDFQKIKNWQAFISYLYKQNYSNDPSREYSGYTLSAGLNLSY